MNIKNMLQPAVSDLSTRSKVRYLWAIDWRMVCLSGRGANKGLEEDNWYLSIMMDGMHVSLLFVDNMGSLWG